MAKGSIFDFDISVSADKKRRSKTRTARGMSGAFETSSRKCEVPGCTEDGKYRAPKGPDNLEDFHWFCMAHVRQYNQRWNFFESHTDEEMEKQFAADRVWDRTTRPFGKPQNDASPEGRAWARLGIDDPMEVLGDNATMNPGARKDGAQRRLPPTERKALTILEAQDHQSKAEIRKLYKALVKDLHPDRNSGRRDDEERLAEVVWAWDQVKASKSFRD